jgi:hypothetical protein
MRLFKAIRLSGISFGFRFDSDETQPLVGPGRKCGKNFNQYYVALIGKNEHDFLTTSSSLSFINNSKYDCCVLGNNDRLV